MFTGIVTHLGQVARITRRGPDVGLRIAAPDLAATGLVEGESIAVSGVCLTVTQHDVGGFDADVSAETLRCTTLGTFAAGRAVNLERALRVGDRLGGHLVSGHVDAVATVESFTPAGECQVLAVRVPDALARYVAPKGSVTLDGVSLTVNNVRGCVLEVNLIPATLRHTTLHALRAGDPINFEADLVARYLERLHAPHASQSGIPSP